jgi:hypothetical protein
MIESLQEFINLVERDDESSRLRLRSDFASSTVWEEVLLLRPDLKRAVTLNKTLDDRVLRLLANDPDHLVRSDIANRRGLPRDLFELLARDPNESVRARIAWNKKTPDEVLRFLLMDQSEFVAEPARKRLGV